MKKQIKTTSLDEMIDRHVGEKGTPERAEFDEEAEVETKTKQEEINETIGEALEGLSDALKLASASRDVVMKLLQFEGKRIDAIENKIDLLMTERADRL